MGMHQKGHTIYRCHFTHLTYLTLTTYPSHPTPPPNHRFDDDDEDFDPDRLAHYDALACGIVSVQRARLMLWVMGGWRGLSRYGIAITW